MTITESGGGEEGVDGRIHIRVISFVGRKRVADKGSQPFSCCNFLMECNHPNKVIIIIMQM